jgi:hypothetical protein
VRSQKKVEKSMLYLMRTDDQALFDIWIESWKDLGHFEIFPVRTSAEAAQHIADQL